MCTAGGDAGAVDFGHGGVVAARPLGLRHQLAQDVLAGLRCPALPLPLLLLLAAGEQLGQPIQVPAIKEAEGVSRSDTVTRYAELPYQYKTKGGTIVVRPVCSHHTESNLEPWKCSK